MPRSDDLYSLPPDLPVPVDDGACDHLAGAVVPSVGLVSTAGDMVDLSVISGLAVVYAYPRTGRPDADPPAGWDLIPGMRGCTPQSCAFRDHYAEIRSWGAELFGLSTQSPDYQREAAERLHLPFPLLSDESLQLTRKMRLPTVEIGGMTLLKRFTLIIRDGQVAHCLYPVFPPDKNSEQVISWLRSR
ncbi:MAG: peroxiredoxin [Candidatus Zixiibacteriota bacterium]